MRSRAAGGATPRRRIWHASRVPALRRLVLLALLAGALPAATEPQLLDGIAAQVDDQVVLVSEVMATVRAQEQAMRQAGAPESELQRLRAMALERLIEERLMQRIIDQNELGVDESEVNRTIEQIAADNGISVEQLYASVVFHGLSVEAYRKTIKGDIERRNLIQAAVGQRVEVKDEEVEALFARRYADQPRDGESVHVRQILRAAGGASKRPADVACAEARRARERVLAGEDFAAVAAELSEVAPLDGGDIGWLPLSSVAPWMSEALEGLPPGGVSEVLDLPFGCSVLQLVERRAVEPVSLEQAAPRLRMELQESKMQDEYRAWVETLREQSFIERRGYFSEPAAFAAPGPDGR